LSGFHGVDERGEFILSIDDRIWFFHVSQ
jgi:hypothetical protein